MSKSILQRARSEGYSDGLGQASQCANDDAYERGRLHAEAYAPSRICWFAAGALFTVAAWFAAGLTP